MPDIINAEKVKPFRLVKYFTFSSLVVIFIGALLLSLLNIHWTKKMVLKKSATYAHLLIENLNHQVYKQFIIPVVLKFGKIQLRKPEQFELMDHVVKSTLHSFEVDTVNFYDMDGTIAYSFDKKVVGLDNTGGSGYYKAVRGVLNSDLLESGNYFQLLIGAPKKSLLVTFSPIRAEEPLIGLSGPILGVVEIVQDLSDDYKNIFRFQILVILTSSAVMGLIFIALRNMVKRGENIIEIRTKERIKLKEQLNRAEKLSALGELIAGISHEIRNPLGIIISSAELLQKKLPDNKIPSFIVEESTRLNNILTEFLNFAKPLKPNLSSCSIHNILDKNITAISSETKEKKCVIEKKFCKNMPNITADADMLYQAFLNLFINATHAVSEQGKICVYTAFSKNRINIFFEDDGPGITQELLNKIWEPFYTTKEKGTGLGLGIVKNIIESHNGFITIENKNIKGVKIAIELPIFNTIESQA